MTSLVLAAAMAGGMGVDGPAALKVMTYNIRYGTAPDGVNAWPLRKERLLELVKRHDPDVLGLQEALESQVTEILAALPGHQMVGVGRDDGILKGEHAAILYRRSLVGMREGGTRWISGTPTVPGSLGGSARITRVFTWGEFFLPGGRRFLAINAHLDHQSDSARLLGGEQMRDWAGARSDLPAIIMGDFNSEPNDPPAKAITEEGRFRVLLPPKGPFGTFSGFVAGEAGDKMIDLILATPEWETASVEIDGTSHEGRTPSDHLPVIAKLRLKKD
jgi:endonuclease/exonuclease/phosphatase family metal-dependent hydrolase